MIARAKEILENATKRLLGTSERIMGMNNRVWARHANPLSAYSRIISGPLIFFAFWSLYWVGLPAIGLIIVAGLWIWLNPRIFPPPKSTDSWATKGVLGERVFLNRKRVPIPDGHQNAAQISIGCSIIFALISIYGFITQNFWAAFAGWHAAALSKIWFVDRCVWLWEEMRAMHPVYSAWDNAEWDGSFEDHTDDTSVTTK